MPVRTTKVDLSAIIRATPILRSRSGGGAGSFGLGLAPAQPHFTAFEFITEPVNELVDDETIVALFRVEPTEATFTLVNDAGELFAIQQDEGSDLIDEGGYRRLVTYGGLSAADSPYTIVLRATDGVHEEDFTREIPITAVPVDYNVDMSQYSFDAGAVDGEGVADFLPNDPRAQIDTVVLTDDAGGCFEVVNRNNLVRTGEPVTDGPYNLAAAITFMDGHVIPNYTFTMMCTSLG